MRHKHKFALVGVAHLNGWAEESEVMIFACMSDEKCSQFWKIPRGIFRAIIRGQIRFDNARA